jgi:hypothetical protein
MADPCAGCIGLMSFNLKNSPPVPPPFKSENKKAISMFDIAFHPHLPRTPIKRKATWIKSRFDAAISTGSVLNCIANEFRSKFHMINKILQ